MENERLFERACRVMPGGVNSPVRAFRGVGGTPVFIQKASGAMLRDVEGREYIDYVGGWGPMILGHANPEVVEALAAAVQRGTSYGTPTEAEVQLAELVCRLVPSIDKLRLTSSGTEATMSAIRVARGFTGREKIVKFAGCYHGHADSLLVKAGSGVATLGLPDSPGVTRGAAVDTLIARFNDLDSVRALVEEHDGQIAAVIVEPVAGNMGCVPPAPGFLEGLREVTAAAGAVLIFDEVMTGFRVALGGAQALYGVRPDMTCLGKVIGGGVPVGAFGGRAEIMDMVAPAGPVYQAGTLSGNPLAVKAGLATLDVLQRPGIYEDLEWAASRLESGIREAAACAGVPVVINRVGSMLTVFFQEGPAVNDWDSAARSDTASYGRFFHGMLGRGVYLPPSQYECWFVSTAHDGAVVDRTLEIIAEAL
jgi:glutamate-1-semialdehyde 2,1-aminomutase